MNALLLTFYLLGLSLSPFSVRGQVHPALETTPFCELTNLQIGSAKEVRVRAVYRVGFEWSELYSLKCVDSPDIWVDFSEDWKQSTSRSVRKEIEKGEGTYFVVFVGRLEKGSFGHMGAYPMRLEVTSIEIAKRIDKQSYHRRAVNSEMRKRIEAFEAP
jgi:hypothetical protein